jgi:hypothetical protein
MSHFVSKPAHIEDCETQIAWNGIEAITSNGEIDDLYLFREALKSIGSTEKLQVIEKAVSLYESVHGRRPDQKEAFDIGCEHSSELNELDSAYYQIDEDLQALCLEYVRRNPEKVELLRADERTSDAAKKLLAQLG